MTSQLQASERKRETTFPRSIRRAFFQSQGCLALLGGGRKAARGLPGASVQGGPRGGHPMETIEQETTPDFHHETMTEKALSAPTLPAQRSVSQRR